ncbi:MAG: NAD-dependent epimerase/dehydratase family protein, partial [Anaerolineales bacterium]|nr:NAD-dependent epimerase/dehydratase family protein [Anaerolineales bacterium]
IACENLLMKEYRASGFPVTIVRPSLTYAPFQIPLCTGSWQHPWTLIHRMKQGEPVIVPGDGTSLWVLTWNADFAVGLLGLLGNKNAIEEAFHITSDEVLTWDQIYLEVYDALGLEPNIVHIPSDFIARFDDHAVGSLIGDKANSVVFDNSKIKRFVPEFDCKVKWSDGVRRALAWFETHPEFQTVDRDAVRRWDTILNAYQKAFR